MAFALFKHLDGLWLISLINICLDIPNKQAIKQTNSNPVQLTAYGGAGLLRLTQIIVHLYLQCNSSQMHRLCFFKFPIILLAILFIMLKIICAIYCKHSHYI